MRATNELRGLPGEVKRRRAANDAQRWYRCAVFVQQPALACQGNGLSAAADAKKAINLAVVPFHRVDGHHQAFGNLAVRQAIGQQTQNLEPASAQAGILREPYLRVRSHRLSLMEATRAPPTCGILAASYHSVR